MHTNGNGEVAFRRIFGGVPHFGRVDIKVANKYYYKQKGGVKHSTWLLWLGANNPTPGLRKTLTDSGFAARLRALGLGACALGAPTSGGEQSASSAKEI